VLFCALWSGAIWADGKNDRDEDRAVVPQTGQVISYDTNVPPRDDGGLQKGVEIPTPRYKDKGNGTIKDNLTGLIWLKNANCPGVPREWQQALNDVSTLSKTGKMNNNDCGDTSDKGGTHRTDWRLPNIRELFSLVDYAFYGPAISNAKGDGICTLSDCAYTNFQASGYWSSTTKAGAGNQVLAWYVYFLNGGVDAVGKINNGYVIAVRGGS
jgi:hypothetical protein